MSQYVSRLGSNRMAPRLRFPGAFPGSHRKPRRIAMLSVHTSPLHQPGTGDAGGMNVYIVELAKRLAAINIEVEIFTRATTGALPPAVELAPGVLVRHVDAGPYEGLAKEDLPAQLCAFTHGVMQAWAASARATTTWSTPTTGSPAMSAGSPRSAGASPRARHAHHGEGEERGARRG